MANRLKNHLPTLLQVLGLTLIVVAVCTYNVAIGIGVAGLALLGIGIQIERPVNVPKPSTDS